MKENSMVDKECIQCKRYYSKSCAGVYDRKRKEINNQNQCSGFLDISKSTESFKYTKIDCLAD